MSTPLDNANPMKSLVQASAVSPPINGLLRPRVRRPSSSAMSDRSAVYSVAGRSTASSAHPSSGRSRRNHFHAASSGASTTSAAAALIPETPLGRLLAYLLDSGWSAGVTAGLVLALVGLMKWLAGVGSHSGFNNPPMYGDFEAQRHWLEITLHLPLRKWYFYDLPYWGLDYPPLTGLHSLVLGKLAHALHTPWVNLDRSRGYETPGLRTFMRAAALGTEVAVWWSAGWAWVSWGESGKSSRREKLFQLVLLLSFPSLTLIDSAHFQFNSAMLGLALWSLVLLREGARDGLACVLFVASLGFKQIALYWAPAIGIWLVAKCYNLGRVNGLRLFLKLALCTSLSFLVLIAPFAYAGYTHPVEEGPAGFAGAIRQVGQVAHRVFPFARGLFEDKVANFWCATNVVVKWRRLLSPTVLPPLALALTALALVPQTVNILVVAHQLPADERSWTRERMGRLLPGLVEGSALGFFLCAFQVHEKAILLPLLGVMLAASAPADGARRLTHERLGWLVLWQNVAIFSMYPLLKRDGLSLPYVVLSALWTWAVGGFTWWTSRRHSGLISGQLFWCSCFVYSSIALLHTLELLLLPPPSLPDLHPVLNVLFCFAFFAAAWAVGVIRSVRDGWGIRGLGESAVGVPSSAARAQGKDD